MKVNWCMCGSAGEIRDVGEFEEVFMMPMGY
jgi:hypothetical protein